MNSHRKLTTWDAARRLVTVVYRITEALPPNETYVAKPQLRRAVWSVPNNIAEGNAKRGKAERRRFFDAALGSLAEIDSMMGILRDIYELDPKPIDEVEQLRRQITAGIFHMLQRGRQ
jgi:four helix bundle protein